MLIADSQVHIWAAGTPERPWPKRPAIPHRNTPYSADDLLKDMDEAGVDRAVIVPPSWEGDYNDLALAAAKAHPARFTVMGRFDPEAPNARALLPTWREQPGMLGMRFHFGRPEYEGPLTEDRLGWFWTEVERLGLPLMVLIDPRRAHLIDRIAERHPRLKLIMDHMAVHLREVDNAAFCDLDKVLALAKRPNIAIKASCLPSCTSDSYPYRALHPIIRRIYDAFGPRRIFWGTDLTRMPCTYRQSITMITEEIPWLSTDDKEWIMGRGLCEWIGWPLPA
jgi:predicted TIM-barrel fold metal-dependent hydrolase